MGDHSLYVRFPDGTVRYGRYQSTADVAHLDLVDTFKAAHEPEFWTVWQHRESPPDGAGEPVDIATTYADGFAWRGTATPECITSGADPFEEGQQHVDGIPTWVSDLWGEDDGAE